jgi:hypothetical protein
VYFIKNWVSHSRLDLEVDKRITRGCSSKLLIVTTDNRNTDEVPALGDSLLGGVDAKNNLFTILQFRGKNGGLI